MKKEKIELLDSTLREGAQSEGMSFSVEDKIAIYQALSSLGIDLIEGGNPGANPKDQLFFSEMRGSGESLAAFGSTCRVGLTPEEDPQCLQLAHSGTDTVVIFGKASAFQVQRVLDCTLEENLRIIRESVRFFKGEGKRLIFDAEHFFDGYLENQSYSKRVLDTVVEAGADVLCLCDTNGGGFPDQVKAITEDIVRRYTEIKIGIHCHNDCGLAVANTIAAVQAGARHVQGTFLGQGERCGNANLCTLIGDLQLKLEYDCIPKERMKELTSCARYIAEICNISLPEGNPFVGSAAFSHKAGMHADGVRKNHESFEHINPAEVGNRRRFLVSEMAGKALVLDKIRAASPELKPTKRQLEAILTQMKEKELQGYQFEAAEASFELLVRREMGLLSPKFEILLLRTMGEHPARKDGSASAMIKVRVGNREQMSAAEGNGPVNALDGAIRRALEVFYPQISEMRLMDFKVRVIDSRAATAARVRVLITSSDGVHSWTTVGVSGDVIEASFQALKDSVEYKLIG